MSQIDQGRGAWRGEAGALTRLAVPLVIGNLAWSAIAGTDLLLLGRLGSDAVAAGALAINLYQAFLIFGMGIATAASPLIAGERGRRRHSVRDIRRTVRQAMWAVTAICLPSWAAMWHGEAMLLALGQDPALSHAAGELLRGLQWALLPYLGFLVLRNFVTASERPGWGVATIVAGIPFNLLAGWALIFGHLGLPPLGLFGAGLAGTVSATAMAAGLAGVIALDRRFRRFHLFGRFWVADWSRFRAVWKLGLPIAITLALEVTVFNAAVFLMGLIDRPSLAAHAVAIQITALFFMVPLGIAQAATVRVGLAFGRGDRPAIRRAGWTALAGGAAFSALSAALLIGVPRPMIGAFLDLGDPANDRVAALTRSFLAVAALFQLVDGVQAIAAGALRGLQDTRVPMIFAGVGYWVIGIGTGVVLAFPLRLGGVGIWLGLATGLGVVAVLLVLRWLARDKRVHVTI